MYSLTLRSIFKERYNVDVGLYSYGNCFNPECIGCNVTIGRYCSIARGVRIMTRNHPISYISTHPFFFNTKLGYCKDEEIPFNKKIIGNDVWIGANALILPNARVIGDGAIIGAGAVVTENVPPYAIVVGNPGKLIRYRFSIEVISDLLEKKWWEKPISEICDKKYFCNYSELLEKEEENMDKIY